MIEKLELPCSARLVCGKDYDLAFKYIKQTVNQLVDAVNEFGKDVFFLRRKVLEHENIYTKTCRMDKEFAEEELDRTRKALDIAVDALKRAGANYPRMTDLYRMKIVNKAIEQINEIKGCK